MPFVGRAGELERLRECAAALTSGAGSLVLLEGEAGAGKTRLLTELDPHAIGGALESVQAPYAPVRDLLAALDRRDPNVLANDPTLAQALRPIFDLQPPDEGANEQRKLVDAVLAALERYAAAKPLLLAIEDVHWIDRASAGIVTELAQATTRLPVMLAITYRGGDAMQREESRALIAQLTRVARVVLPLRPLSVADAMTLIDEASAARLPLPLRRQICELAQGNPLLVLELTRHAESDPGALASGLPLSIQALMHERLALFSNEERDMLRVCAAMETFEVADVAEIAGVSIHAMLGTLRKARAAHMVQENAPGQFVFRHALIRRAVSDEVLGVELRALHARIAERLERESGAPGMRARLAFHYWMAGDTPRAQQYNVQAAEDALALQSYDEAAMLFERALGGRDLRDETYELHVRLAQAYEDAGRHRQCVAVYKNLAAFTRAHRESEQFAALSVAYSRACFYALDDDGSIVAVQDGLAVLDRERHPRLAFELLSLLAWYLVHLRRVEPAREALDQAERFSAHADTLSLIRYYEARAAYEVHANGGGTWRSYIEKVLELADTLDVSGRLRRYANALALAIASNLDDYAFALQIVDRLQVADGEAVPDLTVAFHSAVLNALFPAGQLERTRQIVELLLPYAADSGIHALRISSIGIRLAIRTGDEHLLRACAHPRLLQEAFNSKDPVVFGPVAVAVAEHLLAQNRRSEAMALVERTIERLEDGGDIFDLLLLATRIGSESASRRAVELLERWLDRSRSARAYMQLIRAYAASGKERVTLAREAARGFAEILLPLLQAQALEVAGDRDEALAIYTRTGASADSARLELERRGSAHLTALLSKREVQVAELVAEGRSNRAIADTLVLSERTIENHIASIFGKLNVRSRAEIASYVAREKARSV